MFVLCYYCFVIIYQEEFYVIGGENFWCSVVKFDFKYDEWIYLKDMIIFYVGYCVVVTVNGLCVFVGYDDRFVCYKSVEFYDLLID